MAITTRPDKDLKNILGEKLGFKLPSKMSQTGSEDKMRLYSFTPRTS
jgi:hypothetical protein